jgi:hypothetical protein
MRKVIILSGVLCLLAGSAANARVSVNLNLGEPAPAYVEAPTYVQAPVYPTYAVEGGRYHERHAPPRRHFRHDNHRR